MRSQQEVNAIIRQLCSGLKPLFPQGSMEAILFGSYARGEADADSDIDVMVLVDSSRQDISEKTWEISSVAADHAACHGESSISINAAAKAVCIITDDGSSVHGERSCILDIDSTTLHVYAVTDNGAPIQCDSTF